MNEGKPDPFLVVMVALTCTIVTVSGTPPACTAAAAVLLLVLPGYAVGHALVPVSGLAERLTLSIGLSLALAILAGLALAAVGKLAVTPWTAALSAMTGVGVLGMSESRNGAAPPERWAKRRRAVPVAIAAALATAFAGRAALIEARTSWAGSGGTALALIQGEGRDSDFVVEVINTGPRDATYSLAVTVPGAEPILSTDLPVAAGRRWRRAIPVPTDAKGRLTATLRLNGDGAPLRHAFAWLGPRPDDPWSAPPLPVAGPASNATASVAASAEAFP